MFSCEKTSYDFISSRIDVTWIVKCKLASCSRKCWIHQANVRSDWCIISKNTPRSIFERGVFFLLGKQTMLGKWVKCLFFNNDLQLLPLLVTLTYY